MEKQKNRISTFSNPKEYALPKVLPSERGPAIGKFSSKFPYIFKSLEDEVKEDNTKVRKRTRNN